MGSCGLPAKLTLEDGGEVALGWPWLAAVASAVDEVEVEEAAGEDVAAVGAGRAPPSGGLPRTFSLALRKPASTACWDRSICSSLCSTGVGLRLLKHVYTENIMHGL